MKTCTKCGGTRFNSWQRCMDCRNERAKGRLAKIKANGGSHTAAEWKAVLAQFDRCPECDRTWTEIPARPDTRYSAVWTKGHKIPVHHGGGDSISNIQPECYQCNFGKNAGPLKLSPPTSAV